jgi:hypothetical protein
MKGRSYTERERMRHERRASGNSSVRISKATKAKLVELRYALAPYDVRGEDELIWELATAELARIEERRRT